MPSSHDTAPSAPRDAPAAAPHDWTPVQAELLANIARLYRGEEAKSLHDSVELLAERFPEGAYADMPGLCKIATLGGIEALEAFNSEGRKLGVRLAQGGGNLLESKNDIS